MDYGFSNPDYGYAPHERPEGRIRKVACAGNGRRVPGTDAGRGTHRIMKPTDTPARVGPK